MPVAPSANRFVSGATIDINRPPQEAYNPRDPKNEYPKMLYHPTKQDPIALKEFKRITLYNSLHPEKPELLPHVGFEQILVKSKSEEEKKLAEGYEKRAPAPKEQPEQAAVEFGSTTCSRGCGNPPHRGSCKTKESAA